MTEWITLFNAWYNSWHFANPQMFWLAGFLPIFWLWRRFAKPVRREDFFADWHLWHLAKPLQARHSLLEIMQAQGSVRLTTPETRLYPAIWQEGVLWVLRLSLLLSLLAALAQPQSLLPSPPQAQQKTVRDLLLVVEASASMLLNDYRYQGQAQTRMQAVQQVLDQFMAELPGNRFAITVYAQSAFNLLPLSADQNAARRYLQRLRPYLAGRTDEALAEALGLALQQTQDQNLALGKTTERKRLLILISDGENQPSRLSIEQALDYAKLLQVPIYTIGVGSMDERADQRQFSGLLYQPLQAETLQHIARQTGGLYYQIGSGQDLREVLQKIDLAEGVPWQPPPSQPNYQPLYWQFALLSLAWLGLYWLALIAFRPKSSEGQE